jgi:hypothetical protein
MTNVEAVDLASTVPALHHIGDDPEEKTGRGQEMSLEDFDSLGSLVSSRSFPDLRTQGACQTSGGHKSWM